MVFGKCKSYKKVIMQKLWKSLCNSENAKVSCKIKLVWFLENAKVIKFENAKVMKKCVKFRKCKSYEKVCVIRKMQKLEN